MAKFELKLPKMGESVAEATVTSWLKEVGDFIEADESVVEIATDKVDSDVPSEVSGTLIQILHEKDAVVQVGHTLAIIETEDGVVTEPVEEQVPSAAISAAVEEVEKEIEKAVSINETPSAVSVIPTDRFYSPLVKNIASMSIPWPAAPSLKQYFLPNQSSCLLLTSVVRKVDVISRQMFLPGCGPA